MEQEYVIGVTNRYALFLDENSHEEDPFDIIKNAGGAADKTKKKTAVKTVSGESKENKGKPEPKAKTALTPSRKGQGIKETQNVKPAEPTGAVNKSKPQDGALKTSKPVGGRKPGDKPQPDRPAPGGDKSVKFASGEPQSERPNNRRNREDKPAGERNGDIQRNRNFRDGDRGAKGNDEGGPRGPRNDGDGPRGPRRDNDRNFRGGDRDNFRGDRDRDRDRDANRDRDRDRDRERDRDTRDRDRERDRDRDRTDRPTGENEHRPPRRENRREFQDRSDFQPREGLENGDGRPERRPGNLANRPKGNRGPGRNFDNRGKREFERKSGSDKTGIKAVDKKDGAGAHNWGTHKDDLDSVANNLNSTTLSDETAEWDKTMENDTEQKEGEPNNATEAEPAPGPVEEEPKELTLDEYRAMRGKRELPQYNIRKAGEGEDLTQWKNMYEIKKKKDNEEHDDEEEEYETTENTQRVNRQRHVLDIDITFSDSRRGPRGSRGGRNPRPPGLNANSAGGRNRQREGQRRGRDERNEYGNNRANRQSAPKVDDEHDFPSLG